MSELVEKVAEMPDLPTRTVQLTGITKSERPGIQFEPAPDAAPAACEWARDGHWYWQHGLYSDKPNLGAYCPACDLPIKFTEAK